MESFFLTIFQCAKAVKSVHARVDLRDVGFLESSPFLLPCLRGAKLTY
jgi:hypothetical protein